ncbi:MAG: UDP-2,4-diacetamido-2,4,6-trideoxy-beta-L-altropyranose hydrolase [Rhodocyclales bacterium]|nr:UDP-2,4-diacetamido-2,4,6-trideoxy-beta-L-altropyranose hydrolase [Rhodocyclales bacterium]
MVVLRADASARVGLGHLRRCATLARRLRTAGAEIHFLAKTEDFDPALEIGDIAEACVPIDPTLQGEPDAARTAAYCLNAGADRLIVDHYQVDEAYQSVLRDAGIRWLQFDGAANMPLWADWVVSMSAAADEARYRALQRRPETRLLVGPRYAILRDEFLRWRAPRPISLRANRLLLTFGGGDDRGACLACLEALRTTTEFEITILSSSYNPQIPSIRSWLERNPAIRGHLLLDDKDVARRMTKADIAITAGGTTTFETAMLGLPALVIQIADNQRANSQALERAGVAIDLGPLEQLDTDQLRDKLLGLAGAPGLRQRMANFGRESVDGLGAERIVRELYPDMEPVS